MWTLNERYRVLSSKYEQLEDRFTTLERTGTEPATSHDGLPREESHCMDRDSTDAADENSSRCSPTASASSSMPIVRMISIDPNGCNSTRKLDDDEETPDSDFSSVSMNLAISQNKRGAVVGGIPDHVLGKTPKAAKCGDHRQGGLHAIAAAASLLDAHA